MGGRDTGAAASRTRKATDCRYKDYDGNPAISADELFAGSGEALRRRCLKKRRLAGYVILTPKHAMAGRCSRTSSRFSRRTLAWPSMTRPRFSSRVSRRLMRTLPAAQRLLIADPSLAHLSPLLSPASFVVDGYIGLWVPIGTDAFIQHFVKDKCQAIMEDVDKLDNIQDDFIHYQLIRFCQAIRLQYLNGHIQLANQNVLHSSTSTTKSHRQC